MGNQKTPSEGIIVFARAPLKGFVKTRLAKDLGEDRTLSLYRCFVRDLVDKLAAQNLPLQVFYDPPGAVIMMRDWLGDRFAYAPQSGASLGERMSRAFSRILGAGTRRAVLVGTDVPDLPADFIADALTGLKTHDATIGPALDGGYYLIGFRAGAFAPAAFENIAWSTPRVFATTMDRLASAGLRIHRLPLWRDIDTMKDLKELSRGLTRHPERAPRTAVCLSGLGPL